MTLSTPLLHVRRPAVRHLLGAALLAPALVLATISPASAETDTFQARFETGNLSAWSGTQNAVLGLDWAVNGNYGARVTSTPDTGGYLVWSAADIPDGRQYARIRGWIRVDSADPEKSVGLMTVKNTAGEHHFDFFRDPDSGLWRWDLFRGDSGFSTVPAVLGQWYYVEALVDFGGADGTTYTAQVRIDGQDQPTITSVNEAPAMVKSAWFGDMRTGQDNVREYDSLVFDVGTEPFTFSR